MTRNFLDTSEFTYPQLILFSICAIIWLNFSFILLYAFFESKSKKLYPQYVIIAFFVCGVFTRGLWFLLYPYEHNIEHVGKLSMLFDFSAVSLLVVLWSRSIQSYTHSDRSSSMASSRPTATPTQSEISNNNTTQNNTNNTNNTQNHSNSNHNQNSTSGANISNNSNMVLTAAMLHSNHATHRDREKLEYQVVRRKHLLWRFVMVIVWLYGIISTFVNAGPTIIVISGLCLIIAILMLYIGLVNFQRVSLQLHHFYGKTDQNSSSSSNNGNNNIGGEIESAASAHSITIFQFVYGNLKALDGHRGHRSMRLQIEALRTVLRVSFVVSICYFLQGLAFLYIVFVRDRDVDEFADYNFTYD